MTRKKEITVSKSFGVSKDRRFKLTDDQREEILSRKDESHARLAEEFGVSRGLIYLVCKPSAREAQRAAYLARGGWRKYYNKDKASKARAEHRAYLKKLKLEKGEQENDKDIT